MSAKFFLCVVVVLAASQCKAASVLDVEANAFIVKFKNWVKSKELHFNNSIEHAAQELKGLQQSLLNNAQEKLLEQITLVEKDLVLWEPNLPKKCYDLAHTKLQDLKMTSAADFFHCSNLSKAVADAEQILSKVGDMATVVLELCNTILTGVENCQPYVTPAGLKCINNYVLEVIKELKADVPQLKEYFAEIVSIGKDLRAQVEYCLHPSKAKLNTDLTDILATLHACSA